MKCYVHPNVIKYIKLVRIHPLFRKDYDHIDIDCYDQFTLIFDDKNEMNMIDSLLHNLDIDHIHIDENSIDVYLSTYPRFSRDEKFYDIMITLLPKQK